jgi:phosphohistidine phosphatase
VRLYAIRHAQPEEPDENDPDDDPSLTKEGRKAAETLGEWMADKGEIPTIFYVSPKARTQETAEIVAQAIVDAGFVKPEMETDVSIGPHMSIKGLVERVASDKSAVRVCIVSHHESLEHGMRVLNREPWIHMDIFAEGEMRVLKIDRKDFTWKEHRRVAPSDLGGYDNY